MFVSLYLYNNMLGVNCVFGTGLLSSVAAFFGTYANNWSAHSFDGIWVKSYTEEVYTKPQYRISSYAIGMTAVSRAARNGHAEAMAILIAEGADVDTTTAGCTAVS